MLNFQGYIRVFVMSKKEMQAKKLPTPLETELITSLLCGGYKFGNEFGAPKKKKINVGGGGLFFTQAASEQNCKAPPPAMTRRVGSSIAIKDAGTHGGVVKVLLHGSW
jgi:hypothetical protein